MILMAMPLLLYLRNYSTSKIFRNISLGIFVACVLAVAGTFSRGGFVGLMILFVSMIITSKTPPSNDSRPGTCAGFRYYACAR